MNLMSQNFQARLIVDDATDEYYVSVFRDLTVTLMTALMLCLRLFRQDNNLVDLPPINVMSFIFHYESKLNLCMLKKVIYFSKGSLFPIFFQLQLTMVPFT